MSKPVAPSPDLLYLHRVIKQICRQREARCLQFFSELGHDPSAAKTPFHFPRGSQPFLLKKKDVLHADDIAERSREFADMRYSARTIAHARYLHDQVNGRRDLRPNRLF